MLFSKPSLKALDALSRLLSFVTYRLLAQVFLFPECVAWSPLHIQTFSPPLSSISEYNVVVFQDEAAVPPDAPSQAVNSEQPAADALPDPSHSESRGKTSRRRRRLLLSLLFNLHADMHIKSSVKHFTLWTSESYPESLACGFWRK